MERYVNVKVKKKILITLVFLWWNVGTVRCFQRYLWFFRFPVYQEVSGLNYYLESDLKFVTFRSKRRVKSNVMRFSTPGGNRAIAFSMTAADIICSRPPMEPESRYTLREVIVYLVTVYLKNTTNYIESFLWTGLFQIVSKWIVKRCYCWLKQFLLLCTPSETLSVLFVTKAPF